MDVGALDFGVLGPIQVSYDGWPLDLASRRQRAILAILLLEANRVVSVSRLVDGLWGGRPSSSAFNAVQVYVSRLRHALGLVGPHQLLLTRAPGYELRIDPAQLDLARAESLAAAGRRQLPHDPASATRLLREALALWRGPSLDDVRSDPFAGPAACRLDEFYLELLIDRVDADLALARHSGLVGELEALVRMHPLDERLRARLMLALYRSGRQADALASGQEGRRVLRQDLGLDPGPLVRLLERAIITQDPDLDPVLRLQLPAPRARPTRLTRWPADGPGMRDLLAPGRG